MADVFFHSLQPDGLFRLEKRISDAKAIKRRSIPPNPTTPHFRSILDSFNAAGGALLLATKNQPRLAVVVYQAKDGDIFAVLLVHHRVHVPGIKISEDQVAICGMLEPPGRLL